MGGFRKFLRRLQGHVSGFSLIEVMIAGGLIAFIAIALLPAVFSVTDASKSSGFKSVCAAVVRAKLNEYLNGVADGNVDGNMYAPTGFEYTKRHYQQSGKAACDAFTASSNPAAPGFRESVYGSSPVAGVEYVPGSGNKQIAVMMGFQLWVMIRHYNPRKLVNSAGLLDTTNGTPLRDCPAANDQFFRLGDALEVTVTGMVRTDPAINAGGRGGAGVGKLYDIGHSPSLGGSAPNPLLTCSSTELIYPPRVPFRYYLGGDGKLRNLQASISFASGQIRSSIQAMEAHFRSVWTQNNAGTVAGTVPDANIRSIAVSPDNQWVFVLRPGEISRYGPCWDQGDATHQVVVNGVATNIGGNVTLDGITYQGIPDCPKIPSISVASPAAVDGNTWRVNSNIASIAVDFGSTQDSWNTLDPNLAVYGLLEGASTMTSGKSGLVRLTLNGNGTISQAESTLFTLPADRPRIQGMFIAQTFPSVSTAAQNLYFFDNTCYSTGATVSTSSYCASIFNAADSKMQQDSRELPTQVEAISY